MVAEEADSVPGDDSFLGNQIKLLKAKHADYVDLRYFVDEEQSYIDEKALVKYFKGSAGPETPGTGEKGQSRKLIVVSGPDGFVDYLVGPKRWSGGKECQGPVGGLIGRLDLKGWGVEKL